jgi:type I restriction enzyme S subunit
MVKPGYKQTEVGVIPEDWGVKPLGELASIATGNTPPTNDAANYGEDFLFVGPVDMGETKFISRTEKRLSKKGFAMARRFPKGSILFVSIGSTIGKCGIASVELTSNQQINAILPSSVFLSDYLFYAVSSAAPRIKAQAGEQAVPIVNKTQFSETEIALPQLPEQQAIASALSDVDQLLTELDELITKKRNLKQAVMQQLLTGKTRLPGFTGEWEVKKLGEICELRMGRTPPRLNQGLWGPGYVWLSIADLQSKVVSSSKEQITKTASGMMEVIPKGTLLMSFKLSIGRLCFAGCDLFTNEAICSFNNLKASADYLYYALGRVDFSLYGKQAVKGYTLNKDSLKSVIVCLPSMGEQTAIAEVLSDFDADIEALEQRRDKTRSLKQGMMQELLTGRIRLV